MAPRPDLQERHRQQREASYRRLLEVARELVEEHPWSEVSIALVTERAGLTRTAFYKHFPDRRALLLALFEELGRDLAATPSVWQLDDGGNGEELLRDAVRGLVSIFVDHGRLLEAVAAEAAHDPDVAIAYSGFARGIATEAATRIARDVAEGRSDVEDPHEVAAALVWMNERYLRERFGRHPVADAARTEAALAAVWVRTVYGATRR